MGVEHLLLENQRVWSSVQLWTGIGDAISKAGVTWERRCAQCSGTQLVQPLSLGSNASSLHSSKLFKLSVPPFSHFQNGKDNGTHQPHSAHVRICNVRRQHEQHLARGRCFFSVSFTPVGRGEAVGLLKWLLTAASLTFLCAFYVEHYDEGKRCLWVSFTKAVSVGTLSQGLLKDGY